MGALVCQRMVNGMVTPSSLGDTDKHTLTPSLLTSGDLANDVLVYICWLPACDAGLPSPTGVTDGLQVFIGPLQR